VNTAKKLAVDQLVNAPVFTAVFFWMIGVLEGHSWQRIRTKIEDEYWRTLYTNWMIWPAVNFVNFRYVPLDRRVLVVNTVALGWNTFLSSVQHHDQHEVTRESKLL